MKFMGLVERGFHNLAVEIGQMVAAGLWKTRWNSSAGPLRARPEKRVARRHGGQRGWRWWRTEGARWNVPGPHTNGDEAQLKVLRVLQNPDNLRGAVYGESYMACRRGLRAGGGKSGGVSA